MIRPTRMMLPRLTRRVIQPYATVPSRPPMADIVVMQPEADRAEAQPLHGVEDQHRPGGAEGDVEDQDREHERPHGGVMADPAEALGDLVADGRRPLRVARMGRQRDPAHQHRARGDQDRLADERQRHADGEQRRAERRPGELVERDEPGLDPGVADGQVIAADQHRQQGLRRVVREDLGRGEHEQGDQRDRDRDTSRSRSTSPDPRARRRARASTVTTIIRRSSRSESAPA